MANDEAKTKLQSLIEDLETAVRNARSPKTGQQVPYHGRFAHPMGPANARDLADVCHQLRVIQALL